MYCRVIACDLNGTTEVEGRLAPEIATALQAVRARGLVTLLVTGRVYEDVEKLCADLSLFDAVITENGAVVWLAHNGQSLRLATAPPDEFLGELRARGVPFHKGAIVVGTSDQRTSDVIALIHRFAPDSQLVFNRGAVMILPSGVNKALGVRRALEELDRSEHNLVAFGDAENDLPLFAMAERSVAAGGASAAIAERADEGLSQPGAASVAAYIHRLLEQGGVVPTPAHRRIVLGQDAQSEPVCLPSSGMNVMVSGDPRSGKSWLVGLLAEQLIERGYRVCVFDPEGDHGSLAQRPHVLLLGHDVALPPPTVLPAMVRHQGLSVVLNLGALGQTEQSAYVHAALDQLEASSEATGIPHWILIDEAQYFFDRSATSVRRFASTVNYVFCTYRPSAVSDAVYAAVQAHLITRTDVEEERRFITNLLRARGPEGLIVHDALIELDDHAGLLVTGAPGPSWQIFAPRERLTAHAHHAHKYADASLPDDKAFHFLHPDAGFVAHNVAEFQRAIRAVPIASLRHHLTCGDFSRWAAEVLGNNRLAQGLRKLERAVASGAPPNRDEICAHIEDHYLVHTGAEKANNGELGA